MDLTLYLHLFRSLSQLDRITFQNGDLRSDHCTRDPLLTINVYPSTGIIIQMGNDDVSRTSIAPNWPKRRSRYQLMAHASTVSRTESPILPSLTWLSCVHQTPTYHSQVKRGMTERTLWYTITQHREVWKMPEESGKCLMAKATH